MFSVTYFLTVFITDIFSNALSYSDSYNGYKGH